MLSLTWMLHIYLRIICNNRLNETIDIFVIYFSINWCNICVASRCSKWNYSREIPFSMNKTLKRATRITITGTLVLWCRLSFKGHRLLRSALPEIHGPLDRPKHQQLMISSKKTIENGSKPEPCAKTLHIISRIQVCILIKIKTVRIFHMIQGSLSQ